MPDYNSGLFSFVFVRPKSSPFMYHFLLPTLIVLGGSRVRVPASARNFSVHLQNRTRIQKSPFQFFPRNIRSKALYSNFPRYIRTVLRFTKKETKVRKQEFFMKSSHALFKNCAFCALNIAPTLDVPVLFTTTFLFFNQIQ